MAGKGQVHCSLAALDRHEDVSYSWFIPSVVCHVVKFEKNISTILNTVHTFILHILCNKTNAGQK